MRARSDRMVASSIVLPSARCLSCPSLVSSFAPIDVHSLLASLNGFKDVLHDWGGLDLLPFLRAPNVSLNVVMRFEWFAHFLLQTGN